MLHYQPQVGGNGKMSGVEALVRWAHPERGLIMPDQFISQSEDSGLILQIGQLVLITACEQLAARENSQENANFNISVTVSLRQSIIPPHLLGRVNSVYRFFAWGMMPIGAALGGGTVTVVSHLANRRRALRSAFFLHPANSACLLLPVLPRPPP